MKKIVADGLSQNHKQLIYGLSKQLKEIFDSSKQAMYLYLDDNHITFNRKFRLLLGYKTIARLSNIKQSFLDVFVDKKSQGTLVMAYQNAMENAIASNIEISFKKKRGGIVKANVILVPLTYHGHLFALHFISSIQNR